MPFRIPVFLGLACSFAFAVPNGIEVTPGDASAPKALTSIVQIRTGDGAYCTGTIISTSPPIILTARHCVDDGGKDARIATLTFRDGNLNPRLVQLPKIKKIHRESAPMKDQKDDYAAIELAAGTDIPPGAKPAVFPQADACPLVRDKDGSPLVVAGQGANSVQWVANPKGGDKLLGPVSGVGTLRYGTNNASRVIDGMITFGGKSKDDPVARGRGREVGIGPGDSGGPVYVTKGGQTYLAGVNKYIEKNGIRGIDVQENRVVDTCGAGIQRFAFGVMNPFFLTPRARAHADGDPRRHLLDAGVHF